MEQKQLAPERYDAVVARANELGGIGSGGMVDPDGRPCCLYGIFIDLGYYSEAAKRDPQAPASYEETLAAPVIPGVSFQEVDAEVREMRKYRVMFQRVPVLELFERLGIVRGAE